jgi:hypothetical protein
VTGSQITHCVRAEVSKRSRSYEFMGIFSPDFKCASFRGRQQQFSPDPLGIAL